MYEYSMGCIVMQHPWIAGGLVVVVLVILLLPYEIDHSIEADGSRYRIHALLWSWEYEPRRARLRMYGLLFFQRALWRGLSRIWTQEQARFWAGVQEMLRHWLG